MTTMFSPKHSAGHPVAVVLDGADPLAFLLRRLSLTGVLTVAQWHEVHVIDLTDPGVHERVLPQVALLRGRAPHVDMAYHVVRFTTLARGVPGPVHLMTAADLRTARTMMEGMGR